MRPFCWRRLAAYRGPDTAWLKQLTAPGNFVLGGEYLLLVSSRESGLQPLCIDDELAPKVSPNKQVSLTRTTTDTTCFLMGFLEGLRCIRLLL